VSYDYQGCNLIEQSKTVILQKYYLPFKISVFYLNQFENVIICSCYSWISII